MPDGHWQVLGSACEAAGLHNRRGSRFWYHGARFHSFLLLHLTSFHTIATGSFPAFEEYSMNIVDPLPRPPGSPFTRDYRSTLASPPPTSYTAATFFLHSGYLGCGIYCSRSTGRLDEDQF